MRKQVTGVLVAAVAVAALMVTAGPGASQTQANTVNVVKVVDGPAPDGAEFVMSVECVDIADSPAPEGGGSGSPTFDQDGNPISNPSVSTDSFTQCTVTETVTNGATVTYSCDPGTDPEVECTDDQTLTFFGTSGADGTITVTNTFPEPPPDDVDDDDVVADVVEATPTYTG